MPDTGASAGLVLWRAFVPQWAYAPLSGEGAARSGGRWNRVGQACLYAAREPSTAWAEYNQGFVQHPATIAQLVLRGAKLADLTTVAGLDAWGESTALHACAWRRDLDAGVVPATHALTARLEAQAFDGVIYPSFMSPGGTCVALWRWNTADAPQLEVIDPEHRLPKDRASWL